MQDQRQKPIDIWAGWGDCSLPLPLPLPLPPYFPRSSEGIQKRNQDEDSDPIRGLTYSGLFRYILGPVCMPDRRPTRKEHRMKTGKLTTAKIRKLTRTPGSCIGDGGGLWLRHRVNGSIAFCYRYTRNGRAHEMGLGALEDLDHLSEDLAEAREAARTARRIVRSGRDPIAERSTRKQQQQRIPIFETAARAWWSTKATDPEKALSGEWSERHSRLVLASLENHVFPTLGSLPVDEIEVDHVRRIVEPIWTSKTRTATNLRQRISAVLGRCVSLGLRESNPARWTDNLDAILSAPSKVSKPVHHPALPIDEVSAFLVELRKVRGISARALEFVLLTCVRSGEARRATWTEIDLDAKTWTVTGDPNRKVKEDFRVPLSDRAVEILESLDRSSDLVFPSPQSGNELTDHALLRVLRKFYDAKTADVHGLRGTFRTWSAERTTYQREVCEKALSHSIGNAVEQAYNHGDLFAKRTHLMSDWSTFCLTPVTDADVVPITRQAATA